MFSFAWRKGYRPKHQSLRTTNIKSNLIVFYKRVLYKKIKSFIYVIQKHDLFSFQKLKYQFVKYKESFHKVFMVLYSHNFFLKKIPCNQVIVVCKMFTPHWSQEYI